jgi:hypothetical protein
VLITSLSRGAAVVVMEAVVAVLAVLELVQR